MRLIIIITKVHSLFLKIESPLTISKEKLIWGGELGIGAMKTGHQKLSLYLSLSLSIIIQWFPLLKG